MRRFLLFSSMVLLLCQCALARGNDIPDWPDSCVVDSWEYNVLIQARGNNVTGMCLMNLYPDSSIIGTVVNDFGVKVLSPRSGVSPSCPMVTSILPTNDIISITFSQ